MGVAGRWRFRYSLAAGAVRIGEPDIKLHAFCEFDMTGHLRAAVVRQALPQENRQLLHLASEALKGILRRAAVHSTQHDIARLALHERTHAGTIERPLDQVSFPVAWPLPQRDLLRAMDDPQLLGHEARLRKAGAPAPACRFFLAQSVDHRLLQPATRMRINRSVYRLVADALVSVVTRIRD
jgi:hypothetical protein